MYLFQFFHCQFLPEPPQDVYLGGDSEFETNATRPNLPAKRILNNTLQLAREAQSEKTPVKSSSFIESLGLGLDYIYTAFDDKIIQGEGDVEEVVLIISGMLSEKTLLSFG